MLPGMVMGMPSPASGRLSLMLWTPEMCIRDRIYTVNAYQETCNQRLICEKLMLPKQTVNTILEALTRKGIVEKKADPSDKRNKRIAFTKTGADYAGQLLKSLSAFEEKALGTMTQEEREAFTRTSQIMLARLEEALGTDS